MSVFVIRGLVFRAWLKVFEGGYNYELALKWGVV